MKVNTEWNRRMFEPAEEVVRFICHDCKVEQVWKQRGSVPLRCHPCAKKSHVTETPNRPYDFGLFGIDGEMCERLPDVLHWSVSLRRWMYNDGNRWVKGYEVDAYKIVLELLRQVGMVGMKKNKRRTIGARVDVERIMNAYRGQCEETVRVHGGI